MLVEKEADRPRSRVVSDSEGSDVEELDYRPAKRRRTPSNGQSSPSHRRQNGSTHAGEGHSYIADDVLELQSIPSEDLERLLASSDDEVVQRPATGSPLNNGEDVDEEEGDDDELDAGQDGDRRNLKDLKPIINRSGDDEEDEEEEEEEDDVNNAEEGEGDTRIPGRVEFRPEYDRDTDGFVAGSIVRIRCRGFMTYDYVEFFPGPHLNMILGPNGTGKSSIAAVIAIGLGFPPKVMGRANDLKSYVKQGTEEAETEIELKNRKGKRNVIIRRRFTRENDKSEWFLNGVPSTKRDVGEIVGNFGVQADNLCSFLAQDKVADFAKMAPVKVLEETIKAAGDARLVKWHQTLISKGDQARDLEVKLKDSTNIRDNVKSKVDQMAPEVEQFHQRKEREREREILECEVHVADVAHYRQKTMSLKKERKIKLRQQAQAALRKRPINELKAKQKRMLGKAEEARRKADEELRDIQKSFTGAKRKIDDAASRAKGVDEDLRELKRKAKKLESDKELCQRRIDGAKAILEMPREEIDAEISEKKKAKRDIADSLRLAEQSHQTLQAQNRESEDWLRDIRRKIEDRATQLKRLDDLEEQKERAAREQDGSINWLLDWLQKNGEKLEKTVHKPPMISVNVRDKDLAWQIEACTSLSQRMTFICESKRDYDTLIRLLNGQYGQRQSSQGHRLPAGQIRFNLQLVEVTEQTVNPPRPCSSEQLEELGFAGFAVDFIEAAPAVIAYLNSAAKLHRSAVSRLPGDRVNSQEVAKLGIPTYVTATDVNRITRSNYGRREYQTTTTPPVPARAFHRTVDKEAVKAMADEKGKLQLELQAAEGPAMEKKQKMERAGEKIRTVKKELEAAEQDLREASGKLTKYHRAKAEYDTQIKRLEELQASRTDDEAIERLRQQKLTAAKKLMAPIRDQGVAAQESMEAIDSLVINGFRALQYQLNCSAIEEKIDLGDAEDEQLREELNELNRKVDQANASFDKAAKSSQRLFQTKHPDIVAAVKARTANVGTPEEARQKLDAVIADLEMSAGVDHNFIARYEQLERDLGGYSEVVAKQEKDLGVLKAQIDRTLNMFDPALNSLVNVVSEKFSAAFEKVGCSGEVKIDRKELDFAQWGIQILVSYRDDDPLQILTSTRQSGGERAKATVTYIMSLSEMARTPFSLVDEINQGMDPTAERAVHNQLVGVTCASDAGQYFLITPKLLTDLDYDPRMKVLIVDNGTWLPDGTNKKAQWANLGGCLQRYKKSITAV